MEKSYFVLQVIFNWVIELGTVAVFWVAFKWYGLMSAIWWSLVATVVTVFLAIIIQRRLPLFPLVMCTVTVIFGGYSLLTQEPAAFVFQHTLYYGFGCMLLSLGLINGKSLLKPLFENLFAISDRGWTILARRWAFLFFLIACGNELVWETMSASAWATYKLGITTTVTTFGLWQFRLVRRERLPNSTAWGLKIR